MPEQKDYFPICAIGASAGGVAALRSLFQALPADLDLIYVVILHLSPEHPSAMAEILSSCTTMPVHQVEDGPEMGPNCVYIIPPDRELVIEDNRVMARPFTEPRGHRAPVDVFFRSIAAVRGDGMAVILSGSGADGSSGVCAVHEAGGVVFAQDPSEAEFGDMPRNAIATGVVNFIAPIARMAELIADVSRSKLAVRSLDEDGSANDLRRIVGFLHDSTGHDFASYKRATVMRRVLRRMQVCRITDMAAYGELVRTTPEEAQELFGDLLISVTQFFRDGPAFDALAQNLIGSMFDQIDEDGDRTIRVWSVGCATGEEAYSLAILLQEEASRRGIRVPVQIFASDLDDAALGTAREGRYPRAIEADVSAERLQNFFIDEGTHYRIRKEMRETVLFASHSVLKDPPFLRLDLIVCRNLLIYIEKALQEQLLILFHYALNQSGGLFLGSAETADVSPELFSPLDRDARLYRARLQKPRQMPVIPTMQSVRSLGPTSQRADQRRDHRQHSGDLHMAALEQAAPPSVLVDDAQHILHMSPTAGRYLFHSGGPFSGKLPSVVRPELRLELKLALDRAFVSGQPTLTHPVPVAFDAETRRIGLQVSPLADAAQGQKALVLFLNAGAVGQDVDLASDTDGTKPDDVPHLRAELRAAQEALVRSRGEHESSIEDLHAANEELQSINEEYRSTAEELETSKEELQSMNEELQTVNAELQSKFKSISSAHNDLQNLTSATEIGTLFLDADLRIRIFTPMITKLFSITPGDVGRKIADFTHRLKHDGVADVARDVLQHLAPSENEVQGHDGHWFLMRVRPYRTVEDKIDGVVLTFVDITERREMEQLLLESKQRYQMLFNSIDEGFCLIEMIFDETGAAQDYRFIEVNAAFERQTGLGDVAGKTISDLMPDLEQHWLDLFGRIAKTGVPEHYEHEAAAIDHYYEGYAFSTTGENRIGVLFRDIKARRFAEKQREMLNHELSHRVKNSLAVVQALARQPSPDLTVEQYRARFTGRLQALARAHDELLETSWHSADLSRLAELTLGPYRTQRRPIIIEGVSIHLTPKQGLGLALILHELATNAVKYGSLSIESGNLSVCWDVLASDAGSRTVRLRWQERDGPVISPPDGEGFGTTLIKRAVSYELEGKAELFFSPEGLNVEIEFPHP